jgi:hypothetical protein
MKADCLFCTNPAGSKEHLWAAWIHRRKDFGSLRVTIGKSLPEIRSNPEQKINTVCGKCNNGWMSVLEQRNIPLIGCLLQDLSAPLDIAQQTSLSAWAVKTAMVLDSVKDQTTNPRFYEKTECVNMRLTRIIPDRTRVWIGRLSISALGAYGMDLGIVLDGSVKAGIGMATTIIVGHLAVQVLSSRIYPEHRAKNLTDIQPKTGAWDKMLVPIWPIGRHSVMWPPEVTFTNGPGENSIGRLMDRWRLGKGVDTVGLDRAEWFTPEQNATASMPAEGRPKEGPIE